MHKKLYAKNASILLQNLQMFLTFILLCAIIIIVKERAAARNTKDITEVNIMNGFDKMLAMLTEACETALGQEWNEMTDEQKHDTIMSFIATAAHNAKVQ